jgi:hypothetical protein
VNKRKAVVSTPIKAYPNAWVTILLSALGLICGISSVIFTEYRQGFINIARVVLEVIANSP